MIRQTKDPEIRWAQRAKARESTVGRSRTWRALDHPYAVTELASLYGGPPLRRIVGREEYAAGRYWLMLSCGHRHRASATSKARRRWSCSNCPWTAAKRFYALRLLPNGNQRILQIFTNAAAARRFIEKKIGANPGGTRG